MTEASNLDLLEQKIGETLEKLARTEKVNRDLRESKKDLENQIGDLESANRSLQANIKKLQKQIESGKSNGRDIDSIRARVEGILAKFELLDI